MTRAASPGRFKLVTLRKAREIQRPDAEGARLISRHIVICYAPGLTETPRVAIKASKRLGGAVVRNKIRRRIKEICRRLFPRLKEPLDVLVIPRAAALEIDYGTLENDFWRLFRQRSLLRRG